ncbi:MAG: excinuclease ABC subunit UvrA [Patescibacteria group bacterium]
MDYIKVRGARQHNLKNISLDIPKNKLVVFTGVSGSGKSSLAFDTIYAEGQRRYVESLSTYARQFLGIMDKPDVDTIEGLSPAISIDQKTTSKNPRSTVGTVTEIYDYLRLLYARIGHPHCPICAREISFQSLDQIVDKSITLIKEIAETKGKVWFLVLSPMVQGRKGEFSNLFDNLKSKGYKQVRVDGYVKNVDEYFALIKTNKHTIEAVVDRIAISKKDLRNKSFLDSFRIRLSDSIQQSINLSDGLITISEVLDEGFSLPDAPKKFTDHLFSERFSCPVDNIEITEIEPRTFSFNSPYGACPKCTGLGKILKVEADLVFSDEISITEGGVLPFKNMFEHNTWFSRLVLKFCEEVGINPRVNISTLSEKQKELLLYGTGEKEYKVEGTNRFGKETYIFEGFLGFVNELEKRHSQTESDWVRTEVERYMREKVCPECMGSRLKKEALGVTIDNINISELTSFSIEKAIGWVKKLTNEKILSKKEIEIGHLILKEITERLNFLLSVGLEYLTLDRQAGSLSGGEAQRIRLASQIGSGLTGVLYVLDEPTIGLHPKDNQKLIDTLKKLRDLGNTVIVVEHDAEMMKQSDYVFDFGPWAGENGGKITAEGSAKEISKNEKSLTGKYLSGKKKVSILAKKLQENISDKTLKIIGSNKYNLKNINVTFPLGKFVVVTGVSGSGKSTLLVETLYPALFKSINPMSRISADGFKSIEGLENIDKVILIDQSPIGKTPRSNPATYTKAFDEIRDIFASTKEAKSFGFKKGRFSFNVKAGRCETCEGQGQIKIEMQFMSDIWVMCDICKGKRYNAQTLDVVYRGKNISEVLDMSISDAKEYFHGNAKLVLILNTLEEVGLGYMKLGQPATTLSGGEAQRVKLATELSKRSTGKTIYILDEPTTGLHFYDVEKLLSVLRSLVERGNSVFVIEHNLDVVKNADWIIDLGPDGGEKGGEVIAKGTVGDIKKNKKSYTGNFLSKL